MQVDVTPQRIQVTPGLETMVVVQVRNTTDVICAYTVRVLGLDPRWTGIEGGRLSLFPEGVGVATIKVSLPPALPAGIRRLGVEVTSDVDGTSRLSEVELVVPSIEQATVGADPLSVTAGKTATVAVTVANNGNGMLDGAIDASDPEGKVEFDFEPAALSVAPGSSATVQARATARRPIFGQPKVRVLTFHVPAGEPHPQATVTFIQRPLISRGLLALLGLLAAVTVFAAVITTSLARVVDVSRVDENLLLRAIEGPDTRGGVANPATIAGTVFSLTSNAPVAGVTVELFAADSAEQTVATASTAANGTYTIGDLEAGSYKVRFRGALFTPTWYPAASEFADAQEISLEEGATADGIDGRLGGTPGSISGRVIGDDPTGATLQLLVPAEEIDSDADAIVASVAVDATGSFRIEDVPSPWSYFLQVEKPGFSTTRQIVRLGAGQALENVEILLRKGDGSITGRVFSSQGPLGGVTVTATDGIETVATVSLTEGDVGAFFLRGLPTPGAYTVTFTAPEFATETLSLSLAPGQQLGGISATLAQGSGSITGHVSVVGQGPTGNVSVTVTNGEDTFTTASLTVGDVGRWLVTGLPVPSTYTITFSGDGLANQTRSVDVDPLTGANVTGVDATLTRANGSISGSVLLRQSDGSLVAARGATVTAAGGGLTFTTRTATVASPLADVGSYVLPTVPPGTYTITFSFSGRAPVTTLRTVAAGQGLTGVNGVLEPLGSIIVAVCADASSTEPSENPVSCLSGPRAAELRIYRRDLYPQLPPLAVTSTDENGLASFSNLFGPEDYVIEVFVAGDLQTPSISLRLEAGTNIFVGYEVGTPG